MNIAIIDDQDEIRFSVAKILKKKEHQLFEFIGSESSLINTMILNKIELIILDVMLETEKTGIDLLKDFRKSSISAPVILMTAFTTPENLIEASKLGIYDILQKPFDKNHLLEVVSKYETRTSDIDSSKLHHLTIVDNKFIGSFETMKEVYRQVGLCANNDFAVLINGETGTGKELVANLIHSSSSRSTSPFIAVNCASIPSELFESHFFGHEKGSFTGADRQHVGYAEQVNNGTLFLDEIGELDILLQSKLLRFLENRTFRRVGGTSDIAFKGRIISATNVDLEKYIGQKRFREDLFFRLGMTTINIPCLGERKQDIPLLVDHFISLANKELKTEVKAISNEALHILSQRQWNGNIRELRNTIYNAALNAKQNIILPADLLVKTKNKKNIDGLSEAIEDLIEKQGIENIGLIYEEIEKTFYQETIKKCSNITKLSEYLKISRLTLRKNLKKHGISYGNDD